MIAMVRPARSTLGTFYFFAGSAVLDDEVDEFELEEPPELEPLNAFLVLSLVSLRSWPKPETVLQPATRRIDAPASEARASRCAIIFRV